ncbi:MAG: tetratricopeptide repeat protein [Elusimicrobia bacterium]|nr:tetratricopeptide repeat protein [Elusimicrobiota bacterium]
MSVRAAMPWLLCLLTFAAPASAKVGAEEYERWGGECLEKKDFDCAVSWYRRLTEEAPKDGWNWAYLGQAYYLKDDCAGAIDAMRKAFSLGPRKKIGTRLLSSVFGASDASRSQEVRLRALASRIQGHCELIGGRLDAAEIDLRYAASIDSQNAWTARTLGHAYFRQGKVPAAIAEYDRAIRLDGSEPVAWAARGRARIVAGDDEPAFEDFATAAGLDREDAVEEAYYLDSLNHLLKEGRLPAALTFLDAALPARLRLSPPWLGNRALVLLRLERPDEARQALRQGLKKAPRDKRLKELLAELGPEPAAREPEPAAPEDPAPAAEATREPSAAPPPSEPPPPGFWELYGAPLIGVLLLAFVVVRARRAAPSSPTRELPAKGPPAATERRFSVVNPGAASVEVEVRASASWLEVSPARARLEPRRAQEFVVRAAPGGAAAEATLALVTPAGKTLAEIAVLPR